MQNGSAQQLATLVEIARLYYEVGLSQQEIADRLSVSRSSIALYLQKARDRGIVQIKVVNPQDSVVSLTLEIQELTQIEEVIVVPHGHFAPELRGVAFFIILKLTNQCLGAFFGKEITSHSA